MSAEDRGSFDPMRFAERIASESADRDRLLMSVLEGVQKQVASMQEDVRRGNLNDLQAERRFSDLEMQIRETREAVNLHVARETQAAAHGASEGAVAGMAHDKIVPAVKEAVAGSARKSSKLQIGAMVLISLTFLATFVKEGPAVTRAVVSFFSGVMELDK